MFPPSSPTPSFPIACLGALMLSFFSSVAVATEPDVKQPNSPKKNASRKASPSELVKQLGDKAFQMRERAAAQLRSLGEEAEEALAAGAQVPDREIRYRSQRLLATIREEKLERLLKRFLDQPDVEGYPLPAWELFSNRIGNNMTTRKLFVDMVRSDSDLLQQLDTEPEQAAAALYPRGRQMQQLARQNQLKLSDVVVLVFVGADPKVAMNDTTYGFISTLLHQAVIRTAMADDELKKPIGTLIGSWVLKSDRNTFSTVSYQAMILAMQYDLPEGLEVAGRALKSPKQQPYVKHYAINTVAKLGSIKDLATVEPLLTDDAVLQQRPVGKIAYATQVRDIALACCIHLAGRPLKEFGFRANVHLEQQFPLNPSELGFSDDKSRSKAFDNWRELRERLVAKGELPKSAAKSEAKSDSSQP